MLIKPKIGGYLIAYSPANLANSTILLKKTLNVLMGLHKHLPLFENFDSISGTYKTKKGAMGEYIHALTIQQYNPIVLAVHQGIKVLKYDHYCQRHTVYLPYFMAPFARGTSLVGSQSSRLRKQIMNRDKQNRYGNEKRNEMKFGK